MNVVAEGDGDAARLTLQDAQSLIHVDSMYSGLGVVAAWAVPSGFNA
jgi:hypothetical protein